MARERGGKPESEVSWCPTEQTVSRRQVITESVMQTGCVR